LQFSATAIKNHTTLSLVQNLVGNQHANDCKYLSKFLHIKLPKIISSFWLVKSCQFFPVRPSNPPKNPNFFQNVIGTLDPDFGWYHFQSLVGKTTNSFPEFG
jgi:hypothetical protein